MFLSSVMTEAIAYPQLTETSLGVDGLADGRVP